MSDMRERLKVLIVEDSEPDAELNVLALENEGFEVDWAVVETERAFIDHLEKLNPDVILSDHSMPTFDSKRALRLLRDRDPDIPFILVTGTIGEETAVGAMRAGANDYVLKHNLARLALCVRRELRDAQLRRDRHRAQRAMRINEQRYRTMVVASSQMVWLTDSHGSIVETHPSWLEYTGQNADQAIGNGWATAIHPDDAPKVRAAWHQAVQRGEEFYDEYRIRRYDGDYRWFSCRGVPVRGDGNSIREWIGTCTDITEQRATEAARQASEAKYRRLFDAANDAIFVLADEHIVDCNLRAERLLGVERTAILSSTLADFAPAHQPDGRTSSDAVSAAITAALNGDSPFFEWHGKRQNGTEFWAELSLAALEIGGAVHVQAVARDVTHKRAADQLTRKLSTSVEQASDGIFITDVEGIIEYANPACEKMTGYTSAELIGHTPRILRSGRHDRDYFKAMWKTLLSGDTFHDVLVNRRKDGRLYFEEKTISPMKDHRGLVTHLISTGKDVTEQLDVQTRIADLIYRDPLTGLPNRAALMDTVQNLIRTAHQTRGRLMVAYLGVDRFKLVNEAAGHEVGDEVLCQIATRLAGIIGEPGVVSRTAGDEFAIVIPLSTGGDSPWRWVGNIQKCLGARIAIGDHAFFVATSIGVSLYPEDASDPNGLLRCAQAAMHQVKDESPGSSRTYSQGLLDNAAHRLSIENELHRALENDELSLFYQPQADLETGHVIGAEALMRWQHPDRGLLGPGLFLPVMEQTGLIVPAGEWLVHAACRQLQSIRTQSLPGHRININLSWAQMNDGRIIRWILDVLNDYGLEPPLLGIELTESLLSRDPDRAAQMLGAAREADLHVSLDDFGTGSSSLSYLKKMPIQTLKIDKSFVQDVTNNPDDAAIARAIIAMGHHLRMTVLAEGVETAGQLAWLRREHCDQMQGYLYAKPLSAEEYATHLTVQPRLPGLVSAEQTGAKIVFHTTDSELRGRVSQWLKETDISVIVTDTPQTLFDQLAISPETRLLIADVGAMTENADIEDIMQRVRVLHPDLQLAVVMRTASGRSTDEVIVTGRDGNRETVRGLCAPVERADVERLVSQVMGNAPGKR